MADDKEKYHLKSFAGKDGTEYSILTDSQGNRVELSTRENANTHRVEPYAEIYQRDVMPYRADSQHDAQAASLIRGFEAEQKKGFLEKTPDSTWLPKTINDWVESNQFNAKLHDEGIDFEAPKGLIGQLIPPTQPRAPGYDPKSTPSVESFVRK